VGRNPSIADPVELAALKAAKKRGTRIIVVESGQASEGTTNSTHARGLVKAQSTMI
jgi:hypothetical protein